MSDFQTRSEHGCHNLAFLSSFFLKRFNDWAVTVMFYASVHMTEAILAKNHSIHPLNHKERSDSIAKLKSFPVNAYKTLEREARYSRYKNYQIFDIEVYRLFKSHMRVLILWFNEQAGTGHAVDLKPFDDACSDWDKKDSAKDPECNKWH